MQWCHAIDNTVDIMWCQDQCQWLQWPKMQWYNCWHHRHHMLMMPTPVASHYQKFHVSPHSSCLNQWNATVALIMLKALCDTDASASDIRLSKSHVAPHFSYFDLKNSMVVLTTLLPSQDDREVSMVSPDQKIMLSIILIILALGMQWHLGWCCAHHMMLTPVEWHHIPPMPMPVASCDANVDVISITWQKSCSTSF